MRGPQGPPGPRGDNGFDGAPGLDGRQGLEGAKGDAGASCRDAPDYLTGILLVKHSQTQEIPTCDPGHDKLWDGYSLLYVDGNDYPHNQDLGSPGSCVRRFNTLPILSCGQNNVCNYASRNDKTFWLSTTAPIPMMPVHGADKQQYISRCVVCEVPSNVIAIHSQTLEIPSCPRGWEGLWLGYSFVMVSLFCCESSLNRVTKIPIFPSAHRRRQQRWWSIPVGSWLLPARLPHDAIHRV